LGQFAIAAKLSRQPAGKDERATMNSYNRIAGGSVERLAALSDGVFAVAMTLLLLDLHLPAREAIHDERTC
jgi:hypothetical protein